MQPEFQIIIPEINPRQGLVIKEPYLNPSSRRLRVAAYLLADNVQIMDYDRGEWRYTTWEPKPPIINVVAGAKTSEVGSLPSSKIVPKPEHLEKNPAGKNFEAVNEAMGDSGPSEPLPTTKAYDAFLKSISAPSAYPLLLGGGAQLLLSRVRDQDLEAGLSTATIKRTSIAHLGVSLIEHFLSPEIVDDSEAITALKRESREAAIIFRGFLATLVEVNNPEHTSILNGEEMAAIYTHRIAPVLAELKTMKSGNSYRMHLGREWLGNPRSWVELVGAYILAELAQIPTAGIVVSLGALSISHCIKSAWDMSREDKSLTSKPTALLYKVATGNSNA